VQRGRCDKATKREIAQDIWLSPALAEKQSGAWIGRHRLLFMDFDALL
jgi:hypothetical protein